jgi:hypothetical protein
VLAHGAKPETFKFDRAFPQSSSQEEVFEEVQVECMYKHVCVCICMCFEEVQVECMLYMYVCVCICFEEVRVEKEIMCLC